MTALSLLEPVVGHLAGFIGFFSIPLLGLSLIRMVGGK